MELSNVQIKKILYATDLSESAMHAFSYAVSLANQYGAGITILHVLVEFPGEEYITNMIPPSTWKGIKEKHFSEARDELIVEKKDHMAMKEVLRAFCEDAKANSKDQTFVTDEIVIKAGVPAEIIVQTARERNCDLIVMGTHGLGLIGEILIGSTARWVVRHSVKPVLTIRLP
ncbi:MAG: universal stress protein [Desulfatiglandaceae bacterium]|jgi:nucleotide-binding universal stress UspA family protein